MLLDTAVVGTVQLALAQMGDKEKSTEPDLLGKGCFAALGKADIGNKDREFDCSSYCSLSSLV